MHTRLAPGTYVVAVSGGVDSVVLLDMLQKQASLKLVVAHYDHGIRSDSSLDAQHVKQLASWYGLPFVAKAGKLGANASEATARRMRYEFLHKVRQATEARAVITAHHQDDVVETAILNLLRGTGRRGLGSLRSTDIVVRPLLHHTKQQLLDYANARNLNWREDSTNHDMKYLRNHVRHQLLPRMDASQKQRLLQLIRRSHDLNDEIEGHLINHLHVRLDDDKLDRKWFIQMPHAVAKEILHSWLRRHKISNIDHKTLERLVIAGKAFQPGQQIDVDKSHILRIQRDHLALKHTER